jgi:DNA polymerase III subunit epsilon
MKNLSIVDVETTGLSAARNRVIEIGIIRVEDGDVVERYSQLINPECSIPSFIQHHTGIKPSMIKKAPTFAETLETIKPLLSNSVFIAHNASFDYSFIRAEYRRVGLNFMAPQLCTVRLSRRLFPAYRHHGLDSIIDRFNIEYPARHRALDDAEVVWQFYQRVTQNIPTDLFLTY